MAAMEARKAIKQSPSTNMLKRIEISYIYIDNKNQISPNFGRKFPPIHTNLLKKHLRKNGGE